MTELCGRDRRYLRGLGHGLEPVVFVGKEGIGEPVVRSLVEAFAHRELVKVRLERNCPLARQEAAARLAEAGGAHLVQVLGRTILLYRSDPEDPRLELPAGAAERPEARPPSGDRASG